MTQRAVLVAGSASLDGGGDRLLRVASALDECGVIAEFLVVRSGPHLERFLEIAPTTVLRPGDGVLGQLARINSVSAAVQERRRFSGARSADVALAPPSMLARTHELLGRDGPPLIGVVPRGLSGAGERQVHGLAGADGWIFARTCSSIGAGPPSASNVVTMGPLLDPAQISPLNDPRPGSGAIVIVSSPDLWHGVDHTAELAQRLSDRQLGGRLRVVVEPTERWYIEHDLRHAGLSERVEVVSSDQPNAFDGASVVVNAGYSAAGGAAMVGAMGAGVPVAACFGADLPVEVGEVRPLDVAALAELVVRLDRTQPAGPPNLEVLAEDFERQRSELCAFVEEVIRG